MKILMLTCTQSGEHIMNRLSQFLSGKISPKAVSPKAVSSNAVSPEAVSGRNEVSCRSFYHKKPEDAGIFDVVRDNFSSVDALVFICATGIAVRAISPMVANKWSDPAVLVIDDQGKFCISLLSGHMGGANELAKICGDYLEATPVITTATDGSGLFSVDDFARKNNLILTDYSAAKEIATAVLDGASVEVENKVPGLKLIGLPEADGASREKTSPEKISREKTSSEKASPEKDSTKKICVSFREAKGYDILLYPKVLCLGIGCKRGTAKEKIDYAVRMALAENNISFQSVACLASITLKQDEVGLSEFAQEAGLSISYFSPEELSKVEGDFAESSFVEQVTGVSNVCERSAVLGGKQAELVMKKYCCDGVTVAAAVAVSVAT